MTSYINSDADCAVEMGCSARAKSGNQDRSLPLSPFTKVHHICIVVHDVERSVAYYESLGMGPWFDYPKGGRYLEGIC